MRRLSLTTGVPTVGVATPMIAKRLEATFKATTWLVKIDPNLPAGLLQSCPTLGQSSFGFRVYEAAVRGHREPARSCIRKSAM